MKNKYYAVVNGVEKKVRETTKDHYKYASLELNTFASTKEEVMKRIHSYSYDRCNWLKKHPYTYDENYKRRLLTRTELKEKLNKAEKIAEEQYQRLVKKIVEVYIK